MNGDEGEEMEPFEEERASWMAAGDDALAAGGRPGDFDASAAPAELRGQLHHDLEYLRQVRQVLRRPAPATVPGVPWTCLGRFQIRRELGQGGFGMVFLAHDPLLRREVALKVPRADALVTPELRDRFHREARAASGLNHPNLVPVYEVGEVGPVSFIVTAYCPGTTLAAWLKQRADPVPFDEAARLTATLAEAVEHAHRHGVCHRDLKPANILLKTEATGADADPPLERPLSALVPMVADFGLARLEGDATQTETGDILGTPDYMAPEQAGGRNRLVGPAADVYALGAILNELVTGRPPFRGETKLETLMLVQSAEPVSLSRLRPRVPRDLETICLKCLEKEPTRRYGSAEALAGELRRFLERQPIRARPVGRAEHLWRWCRRNPGLAGASGLAAGALVAAAALLTLFLLQQANALHESEQHRLQAERQAAGLALDQGIHLGEQGQTDQELLWLARSLELAPPSAHDLTNAARLNLGGCYGQLRYRLRHVLAQPEVVWSLAFSPDGQRLVTGREDGTVQLWNAETGTPIGTPQRHGDLVAAVAFSADGRMLVSASWDTTAQLWNAATGERVGQPLRHPDMVRAVAFSPNGRTVVTGCRDGKARLWDVATQQPRGEPLPHGSQVYAVAFRSSDDGEVLTGGGQKVLRWDTGTGKPLGRPLNHPGSVLALAVSPDGQTVVTGGRDQTARPWRVETGEPVGLPLVHEGQVLAVAFGPDSRTVLTGASDKSARLWDLATGKLLGPPLRHAGGVRAVAFRPDGRMIGTGDGRMIGTGDGSQSLRLWDVMSQQSSGPVVSPAGDVRVLALSLDAQILAVGTDSGWTECWKIGTGHRIARGYANTVLSIAISPDGKTVLTGHYQFSQLWDVATNRARGARMPHRAEVWAVAFSPDGQTIVTGSEDGDVWLRSAATGMPLVEQPLRHKGRVNMAVFSPDGRAVLTGSADGTARLWETATGQQIGKAMPHDKEVLAVGFSPDGQRVLTGSLDRTARLWDAATGRPRGPPLLHGGAVQAVALGGDGRTALTGGRNGTARLWDAVSGRALGLPLPHQNVVLAVALSPDGRTAVTGSYDQSARLWDTATGKPMGPPLKHGGPVRLVTFRSDGNSVQTASDDRTVRTWELPLPVTGDVERIVLWIQVLTALELDADNVVEVLDPATWQERRRRLEDLGGPPVP
jgi:WD40 repeat protein/tRNA A-37 threonylcarbamoyl transferase component Bud32